MFELLMDMARAKEWGKLRQALTTNRSLLEPDSEGDTLLNYAIGALDETFVQVIIECGANLDFDDGIGYTYLHHCIDAMPGTLTIGAMLLSAGANPNIREIRDWTPLHHAVIRNSLAFISLLLDHGADVNARLTIDVFETPLMMAVVEGHADIVKLLLARGADPLLRDLRGLTAEELVTRYPNTAVTQVFAEWHQSNSLS